MALGVRLPEDLDQRLGNLAKKTHRSKSYYVTEALKDYLEANEKTLCAIAAYEEDLRNGTLKTFSLEEIKKRHDLD